ncbi:hypothetical protein MINT15_37960 [Saccharomonospora viridis]|uniref:Uncharacterized protein n=1 Tax=Saccharomonospora viridis TaxID=1852 RepID=A0A837DB46_9PSEU|nr:hypothetical protein MINT15_37960 [Saccharomonospora viridis]
MPLPSDGPHDRRTIDGKARYAEAPPPLVPSAQDFRPTGIGLDNGEATRRRERWCQYTPTIENGRS